MEIFLNSCPWRWKRGFTGIHGLEPWSLSLSSVKADYGEKLALIGNADVRLLCDADIEAVHAEIRRCLEQGGRSGYMLSTCNSIFKGMNPIAVREFFKFQAELIGA